MKIPALFKEYIWLLETINRYGKISFAEWKSRITYRLPFVISIIFSWHSFCFISYTLNANFYVKILT